MRLNFMLVVVIVVALIASGFFFFNYLKKSTTVEELEEQIANSNKEIQELTISNETLAKEIDDIDTSQTAIQDAIIAENSNNTLITNSNEVIRDIMELGLKNGTSVIPLSNSGWTDAQIPQSDYQVLKLNLTIAAKEHSIINFVRDLQDLYPTLVIETLAINTLVTTQTSDSGIPNETATNDGIQSNITIAIYSK